MKIVRFERLLASTALGLVLALSSHASWAQKAADPQVQVNVPLPDPAELPPITANDASPPAAGTVKTETKSEPAKAEAAPVMTAPAPAATVAVPAAPAPAVATDSATADNAVADKLRETIASKALERSIGRKGDRAGIEAFYSARNYAPLWVANGAAGARARSAISYLAKADTVGLDPNDYPTPDFNSAITAGALADAELKLTAAALNFARQAQTGRIHYTRVAGDIQFNIVAPEPADVLAKLAGGNDAGKVLDSYNPPQAGFKALKAKLAELRSGAGVAPKAEEKKKPASPQVRVPEGKTLRLGMKDERVIALRKRLDVPGDKSNREYDEHVRDAVKGFQAEADLDADGNAGASTVRALNGGEKKKEVRGPTADPIDTVIVNMDRWRWLPRNLGNSDDTYVVVNPPDYTLSLVHNGKLNWTTKIVVGRPSNATPMVTAEMKFITINPTWNVPPSIIENEYLPALREDPQALERIGLKLEQAPDGTVRIYQLPGDGNALGRIRFNFPNKFLVYQHDTPDKYLFARDKRAYSHGCMRVQNPLEYATRLLEIEVPQERYTPAKIQSMYGPNEVNINFPKPIPVHLTYQTAFVDQDGKLQMREDVYGRDARMIAILKSNERKVADIAIERQPDHSDKPVKMPVGMYGGSSYGGGGGGGNFFDWLFGGAQAAPEYRPRAPIGPRGPNGRVSSR